MAGADEDQVSTVERLASCIGKAFQIQDDILDVISTTEILGKPVGSDEKNHKTTYVSLYGLEEAKRRVAELSEHALASLRSLNGKNEYLEELFISLMDREC